MLLTCRLDYPQLMSSFDGLTRPEKDAHLRNLCRTDLYFLLRYVLNRPDIDHEWLFQRCREVQANPNGHLDLWAREHYKSTIITFGLTIQDILASHGLSPLVDREITVGIFSHIRPIAKDFLRQIKRELEANRHLKELFPDILWDNPHAQAPKWSEDDGLIVKRRTNPKEATVEAWGLVDAMPTGKHFLCRVYDDVVTEKSITTPEMIEKTTKAWELSDNLGAEGGTFRVIGTRYHFGDTYQTMMDRGVVQVRQYPATDDGTETGDPVLMSAERLRDKRRVQGPYTFACQMLQNPVADATMGFRKEWLQHYDGQLDGAGMNIYILVDPANDKKKKSDWTAILVLGLSSDNNYYLLDIVRDRLSLVERADALFRLHHKWRPTGVGYEEYGMQADIQYMNERMGRENYRFGITPLKDQLAKTERIRRLLPIFEQERMWMPWRFWYTNYEKIERDLIHAFIHEEYLAFPVGSHDDMLDAMSRVLDEDLAAFFPMTEQARDRYAKRPKKNWSPWAA